MSSPMFQSELSTSKKEAKSILLDNVVIEVLVFFVLQDSMYFLDMCFVI